MGSGWLIDCTSEVEEGKGMTLVTLGEMSMSMSMRRSLVLALAFELELEPALARETVHIGADLRELRGNLGGKMGRE